MEWPTSRTGQATPLASMCPLLANLPQRKGPAATPQQQPQLVAPHLLSSWVPRGRRVTPSLIVLIPWG